MSFAASNWPPEVAAYYRRIGCWNGETLPDLLERWAETWPENTALVSGTDRFTYARLRSECTRLAVGLQRRGLRSGDYVVLQLPNSAEFVTVLGALSMLGVVPVMALPGHRLTELSYFCQHTEARAVFLGTASNARNQLAAELRKQCSSIELIFGIGEADDIPGLDSVSGDASGPGSVELVQDAWKPNDRLLLQLSGGSTGTPKLIPRTHDDYLYSVRQSAKVCDLSAASVVLTALPASHNFPLSSPGILGVLCVGGTVVMSPSPRPEDAFPLIQREKVTMTALVPALIRPWLDAATNRSECLASLRVLQVGGARLEPDLARRIESELGVRLQQVFGMAEGLVCYTRLTDTEQVRCESQGRPMSSFDEVRIVDNDDKDVADGIEGQLLTRGPYTVRGYFRAEEHNRAAFDKEGYYRTGDIVKRLPDGNLRVVGRAKDQVNRGGEKVAAAEVEGYLAQHPQVREAAVIAVPDEYLGERSCACVVLDHGKLAAVQLRRFLRDLAIADYKIPDTVVFVEALPKTAVGKVDKKALGQMVNRNQLLDRLQGHL